MRILQTIVVALITVLSACSMDPVHVEEDFGNSVRQMVIGQISDPAGAANPSIDAPDLLDGSAAEKSILSYRKDAARIENVQREIQLSID